jgi:hypothetical protein
MPNPPPPAFHVSQVYATFVRARSLFLAIEIVLVCRASFTCSCVRAKLVPPYHFSRARYMLVCSRACLLVALVQALLLREIRLSVAQEWRELPVWIVHMSMQQISILLGQLRRMYGRRIGEKSEVMSILTEAEILVCPSARPPVMSPHRWHRLFFVPRPY